MSKEQTALERIKDEIAIESGWPGGWSSLADDGYSVAFMNQVAKRYARECCQATIEDYKENLKADISKMMTLNGITRHPFKVEAAEILKLIDSIK